MNGRRVQLRTPQRRTGLQQIGCFHAGEPESTWIRCIDASTVGEGTKNEAVRTSITPP